MLKDAAGVLTTGGHLAIETDKWMLACLNYHVCR